MEPRRWQFSIQTLFAATNYVGIYLALLRAFGLATVFMSVVFLLFGVLVLLADFFIDWHWQPRVFGIALPSLGAIDLLVLFAVGMILLALGLPPIRTHCWRRPRIVPTVFVEADPLLEIETGRAEAASTMPEFDPIQADRR